MKLRTGAGRPPEPELDAPRVDRRGMSWPEWARTTAAFGEDPRRENGVGG